VSVLFQTLRDKIASGRHAVSVYEMSPLPPLPSDIVVAESVASEPQKSVVDESATAHYHSDITANDPGHRSTGHQSTATDAGTNWSHNSTTAYTSSSEEAYAQDPTLFNRVWRAIRKGSAKYVVYIIPLFVLTIGDIVMITYLVWGNKQGPLGNEGTGGLYLNAFGDCTLLNDSFTGPHGILGSWGVAGHILDIISLATSGLAIVLIAGCTIRDHIFLTRVSFRLTFWLALSSAIYSITHLLQYNNGMQGKLPMALRVVTWLGLASELCVVLVCVLVAVHLVLVQLGRLHLAGKIHWWYDVLAVGCSLLIAHPVLYLGTAQWDSVAQVVLFDGRVLLDMPVAWAVYLAWTAVGSIVCLGILVLVVYGSFRTNRPRLNCAATGGSLSSSTTQMHTSHTGDVKIAECPTHPWDEFPVNNQKTKAQPAALRVACYLALPLVTQIWPIAYALAPKGTWWLYRVACVVPSIQGIAFLALLAVNPACDELWQAACHCAIGRKLNRRHQAGLSTTMNLEFANMNASTIHLSPYQSRQPSIALV
ncbi:hypothetical protein EV175_000481, partial [Coemansia sp. RSA 1933]